MKKTTRKASQSFTLGLSTGGLRSCRVLYSPAKLKRCRLSKISTRILVLMMSLLLSWRWQLHLLACFSYVLTKVTCQSKENVHKLSHATGRVINIHLETKGQPLCYASCQRWRRRLSKKKMLEHPDQHHLIGFRAGHSISDALTCLSISRQVAQQQRRSTDCLPQNHKNFWPCVPPLVCLWNSLQWIFQVPFMLGWQAISKIDLWRLSWIGESLEWKKMLGYLKVSYKVPSCLLSSWRTSPKFGKPVRLVRRWYYHHVLYQIQRDPLLLNL